MSVEGKESHPRTPRGKMRRQAEKGKVLKYLLDSRGKEQKQEKGVEVSVEVKNLKN